MNFFDLCWAWPADRQDLVRKLAREAKISPALARLLVNRGIDDTGKARAFLNPSLADLHSPWLMCGMRQAVMRIREAIDRDEKITVHGDYDADGITATVILVEVLQILGGFVNYYLPSRFDEGYGLHRDPLRRFKEEETSLVITVDCGINAAAEIAFATEIGLDLIITDHHQPLVKLPETVTVVNPLQDGCSYPFKELSGAGIAFKLACALFEEQKLPVPESLLDLAALGTAADVVPLIDENRILVSAGLVLIRKLERVGLSALADAVSLDQDRIDSRALSYILAPALNAAGRMGEADPAARLLLEKNNVEAKALADHLHMLNQERRSLEQDIYREATAAADELLAKGDQAVITLASENWHHGVIGIVASRLTEKYRRPAALIALENGEGRGSARSTPGFDITAALAANEELLVRFGGHEQAAGFTVKSDTIDTLRQGLNHFACQSEEYCRCRPLLELEAELNADEITDELASVLDQLEPFGQDNPEPIFGSRQWEILGWRLVGADKKHLKLDVGKGKSRFSPIFFAGAAAERHLEKGREVDLAFRLKNGYFRGEKKLDLFLKAFRYADSLQAGKMELIDHRDSADREGRLKQLLFTAGQKGSKTAVFCTTKGRAEKLKSKITGYKQVQLITGSSLNNAGEPGFVAERLIIYDLPISEDQLRSLAVSIDSSQVTTIYLLFGSEDLALTQKMLDMSLPSGSQLEAIWEALSTGGSGGGPAELSQIKIKTDLFAHQTLPRFWEKAELIFSECALLLEGSLTEPAGEDKSIMPELLACSQTYFETREQREASIKFQQFFLTGSLAEIALFWQDLSS